MAAGTSSLFLTHGPHSKSLSAIGDMSQSTDCLSFLPPAPLGCTEESSLLINQSRHRAALGQRVNCKTTSVVGVSLGLALDESVELNATVSSHIIQSCL